MAFAAPESASLGPWGLREAFAGGEGVSQEFRGLGFRVQGLGFRVQGSGFRVGDLRVCILPEVDRIWLWVFYNKIPIYPIFYLLKGDDN